MALVMIAELCLFSPKVVGWKHNDTVPQQEYVEEVVE